VPRRIKELAMRLARLTWAMLVALSLDVATAADKSAVGAAAGVAAGHYVVDKHHVSLTWQIRHMGLSNYTARFTGIDIDLDFDPLHAERIKVRAKVDPLSVRTDYVGEKKFDDEIAKDARFFNAGEFPEVSFVSRSVALAPNGHYRVIGDLKMLGVARPVMLDVRLIGAIPSHPYAKVPAVGFEARASLRRGLWGMTALTPSVLGDEVTVMIDAEFLRSKD
jgi:polyisoprenoid-binding protein YceI